MSWRWLQASIAGKVPIRPSPYTWALPAFDPADVEGHLRGLVEPLGLRVRAKPEANGVRIVLSASPEALERAVALFDSDRDGIDAPEDGKIYRLLLRLASPDDDDPRPRLVIPADERDNWAAWPVVGPLGDRLAEALAGIEITGDPPPWIERALLAEEPPTPPRLPFLTVRKVTLFPDRAGVVSFGRAASVAALARILDCGETRIALVVQRDPSREEMPLDVTEVLEVGVHARILKAVRQNSSFVLVLKGIGRVTVRALDGEAAAVEDARETGAPGADVAALRAFAAADPLLADRVGASLLRSVRQWPIGSLADRVAEASDDADLCAQALLELDTARRAALVAAAVLP